MTDDQRPFEAPDELVECMASDIHAAYLFQREKDGTPSDHPALRAWEELPDDLKGQNRRQARENLVRLARMGFDVVPAAEAGDRAVRALGDDQVEALAREEHDSWCRQKRTQGYRWGPERCDEPPRLTHPDLLAWEELDEDVRDKDREPIGQMFDVLGRCGWAAVPAS